MFGESIKSTKNRNRSGFGPVEFKQVGALITEVLDGLAANGEEGNGKVEASVRKRVKALTDRFPIY